MVEEGCEVSVLAHVAVEGTEVKFSNIDKSRAKVVHKLHKVLVSWSNYYLVNTVENNAVGPTPFTRKDIKIARDVAVLKGKATKKSSKMPNTDEIQDIPSCIIKNYSNASLYIYGMHITRIIFLVGASKNIDIE